MVANQTSMIGPKTAPTRRCRASGCAKSPTRMATVARHDEPVERWRRDLQALDGAERTEIAGVMTPSP